MAEVTLVLTIGQEEALIRIADCLSNIAEHVGNIDRSLDSLNGNMRDRLEDALETASPSDGLASISRALDAIHKDGLKIDLVASVTAEAIQTISAINLPE